MIGGKQSKVSKLGQPVVGPSHEFGEGPVSQQGPRQPHQAGVCSPADRSPDRRTFGLQWVGGSTVPWQVGHILITTT